MPSPKLRRKCCYKLSKCIKRHLFHSKLSKLSFWVKVVVILSVAQLVTTFIFFWAWDKSPVKWPGQLPKFNTDISSLMVHSTNLKRDQFVWWKCMPVKVISFMWINKVKIWVIVNTKYILMKLNWNSVESRKKYQYDLSEVSSNKNKSSYLFMLLI